MTTNTDRIIKVYTDAGFDLTHHSFKSVGKNQVRVTIRTRDRIKSDHAYTINLFCNPLKRAGFKVVRYSTKSDPMPTIIPIMSFDPVHNAEIQQQREEYRTKLKGTLSILVELPEDNTESRIADLESERSHCANIRSHLFNVESALARLYQVTKDESYMDSMIIMLETGDLYGEKNNELLSEIIALGKFD